ncbi:unnamed protein product, partial [Gongylonema pulchrum]|uniref:Serine/threonine protein kinase n=1 Tax=Gongylonema pulchrum TaxID=637853 RepID=A0A183EI85_9BILA
LLWIWECFLGLPETAVDSEEDDESCPSYDSFHELKDSVRECLEKEPSERTADDICTLLHNERIDAWSVIVNGQVEVVLPDGERIEYKLGDSFGVKPVMVPQVRTLLPL